MGYYKDLRNALNSTRISDKESKEYKMVMEAKKPLLDIIEYQREELDGSLATYIDSEILDNIGRWGTPELIKKVHDQICRFRKSIYKGVSTDKKNGWKTAYKTKCTIEFRSYLYQKCGILYFIDDDFTSEGYIWTFSDSWGTPWYFERMKEKFFRKYLVEFSKKTGEGFFSHTPEELIERIHDKYGFTEEEKEDIKNTIREATSYLVN